MKTKRTLLSLAFLAAALPALAEGPAIGAAAPVFDLKTIDGKDFSLASAEKTDKLVVLMFIATQCPYSNAYNDRMRDMAAAYAAKGRAVRGDQQQQHRERRRMRSRTRRSTATRSRS